jgi:hypothetical protein
MLNLLSKTLSNLTVPTKLAHPEALLLIKSTVFILLYDDSAFMFFIRKTQWHTIANFHACSGVQNVREVELDDSQGSGSRSLT